MSSAIKTPAFAAKASNILNEDDSSIYSGGEWSFKNASAVTGFHVASDGKVGVGTTSPISNRRVTIENAVNNSTASSLYLSGAFTQAGDTTGIDFGGTSGNPFAAIRQVLTNAINGASALSFYTSADGTAPTERMRIDASGNLLVGTTVASGFDTQGARLLTSGQVQAISASNSDAIAAYRLTPSTGDGIITAWSNVGGTRVLKFAVFADGNVRIAAGSTFGNFSDIKFKENIVDATPKLDDVLKLQVRNFTIKNEGLKAIGFIAQEFEQVFPALVVTSPDKDCEGNDLGTESKAIKESALIPILVKSIQELSAKVDAQAAEIEALKAK